MNLNKKGSVIVVIGARGQGKSPWIKKTIENFPSKNVVVYDPRHEYEFLYDRSTKSEYTIFHKWKYCRDFIPQVKNSFIIIEEATGVLSSYKDVELSEMMTSAEHNNNTQIYVFHSAMDAPPYIVRNCNYIILFNTGDDVQKIKRERNSLLPYWKEEKPVYIKVA